MPESQDGGAAGVRTGVVGDRERVGVVRERREGRGRCEAMVVGVKGVENRARLGAKASMAEGRKGIS